MSVSKSIIMFSALIIPQRYVLGMLGLFALANSFTMRVCLSMAITQMVQNPESESHIVGETCSDVSMRQNSTVMIETTTPVYEVKQSKNLNLLQKFSINTRWSDDNRVLRSLTNFFHVTSPRSCE